MTFDEYMKRVENLDYPDDPRVPMGEEFTNNAGAIVNLAFGKFGGVALIYSEPESVRSNHYHKTDSHFLYVIGGKVEYYYRPAGQVSSDGVKPPPKVDIFYPGEMFFTPPMMEHAVYSVQRTAIVSISKNARRHKDHEADLVRVELISIENGQVRTH